MLKQYSAAGAKTTKWNLNMLMLVVVEKAICQAQSLKQRYSHFSLIERFMCDNFKCYSLNVVHASSQVDMDAGLYFTLVSLLFSISIFNIFKNITFTCIHCITIDHNE